MNKSVIALLFMLTACAESNNQPVTVLEQEKVSGAAVYGQSKEQVGKILGNKKTTISMDFNHNGKSYQVMTFEDALALFAFENGKLVYIAQGRNLYPDMDQDTGTDKNKVLLFEKGMGEFLRELGVLDYRNVAKTHAIVSKSETCIFDPPCKSQGITGEDTAKLLIAGPIVLPIAAVLSPLWVPGAVIDSSHDNALDENIKKVQLGMSFEQVTAITGIPVEVRTSNDKTYEVLVYQHKSNRMKYEAIGIRNGRVEWRRS